MKKIQEFYKLHGCGNDFIIVDIRSCALSLEEMQHYAKTLCTEHFSIGADGIVFIDNATDTKVSYAWHFYNADGSRAEMCGNASRCVAYIACHLGIADKEHYFQTDVGDIHVIVDVQHSVVRTQLTPPHDEQYGKELTYEGRVYQYHSVNTGVPHVVVFVDDIKSICVDTMGSYIRHHDDFAPAGTNVNFVHIVSKDTIYVRTFERGVEAETFACGTGAVASVVVSHGLGKVDALVNVHTLSKDIMQVSLCEGNAFLQAPVTYVYKGILI